MTTPIEELESYYQTRKSMEDALAAPVLISNEQVHKLVVSELMRRYLSPSNEKPECIKQVLTKWYLSGKEFEELAREDCLR